MCGVSYINCAECTVCAADSLGCTVCTVSSMSGQEEGQHIQGAGQQPSQFNEPTRSRNAVEQDSYGMLRIYVVWTVWYVRGVQYLQWTDWSVCVVPSPKKERSSARPTSKYTHYPGAISVWNFFECF